MNHDLINKAVFARYNPKDINTELEGCIGAYDFCQLNKENSEQPVILIYGLWVIKRGNRVSFAFAGGEPPSVRAGLALDLHQAAAARIRTDAPKIRHATAYYIDDAGKIAASSLTAFHRDRAPVVRESMTEPDFSAVYDAISPPLPVAKASPAPAL